MDLTSALPIDASRPGTHAQQRNRMPSSAQPPLQSANLDETPRRADACLRHRLSPRVSALTR